MVLETIAARSVSANAATIFNLWPQARAALVEANYASVDSSKIHFNNFSGEKGCEFFFCH